MKEKEILFGVFVVSIVIAVLLFVLLLSTLRTYPYGNSYYNMMSGGFGSWMGSMMSQSSSDSPYSANILAYCERMMDSFGNFTHVR